MDFRPGDWLCSCGAHNYASKSACFKCKIPRDAAGSQQAGYQQQASYQQPGAYQQPPSYQSQAYSSYGAGLPGAGASYGNGYPEAEHSYSQYSQPQTLQQQPPSQQRYGDFNARDADGAAGGYDNFRAGVAGASQAALQQALAGFDASVLFPGLLSTNPIPANFRPGDWFCVCGNHNYAIRTACGKCGKTKAGAPGSALPGNFRPGDWMCKCGNHNYQSRSVCGKCHETKDNVKPTAPQMAPNFQVGDWMCICGAHNYQSKSICYKCNLAKESAQADLPATATPGFRAGDWLCESCKNHNYASRIVCGRCKTPKSAEASKKERSPTATTRDRSRSPKR